MARVKQPKHARPKKAKRGLAKSARIYTLDVYLIGHREDIDSGIQLKAFGAWGPFTSEFLQKKYGVLRSIQIRDNQTLERLHEAIHEAFDREDCYTYEFRLGKNPTDRKGPRYKEPADNRDLSDGAAGHADDVSLGDLALKRGCVFFYLLSNFEYSFSHAIKVKSVRRLPIRARLPRMIRSIGESSL
jgi:hypothetical protein